MDDADPKVKSGGQWIGGGYIALQIESHAVDFRKSVLNVVQVRQ